MSNIYKILKNNFSTIASIDINYTGLPANVNGMTVSHYACSWKETDAIIPFAFEGLENFTPYIKDSDFSMVARKRVDMDAIGVNQKAVEETGKDVGKYDYKDSVPNVPQDLPPGFTQLYRK